MNIVKKTERMVKMSYVFQFMIILAFSFAGEALHALIPLPVPAGIYGLVLMLAALTTKLLPLEKVREAGRFLLDIMPMMFIPAAVGLMVSWSSLKEVCIPIMIMSFVPTVLVMAVSGRVTQGVIHFEKKKEEKK